MAGRSQLKRQSTISIRIEQVRGNIPSDTKLQVSDEVPQATEDVTMKDGAPPQQTGPSDQGQEDVMSLSDSDTVEMEVKFKFFLWFCLSLFFIFISSLLGLEIELGSKIQAGISR